MAHLEIEYSPGLEQVCDIARVCRELYEAMVRAGIFPLAGIRVRAYRADYAIVADNTEENNFLALTLSVGAGRTVEDLKAVGEMIFQTAQKELRSLLATLHFALSLEIRVIDPALSWKDTPIHARLAGQN
ncbi:MAG: 5-carboxymethyl-2-hydroxymuconate isomerase [Ahrensia sp.]|nr:5-carboxymethyl-2-hydroxymuconate isomerase [Ahrensia sp.]